MLTVGIKPATSSTAVPCLNLCTTVIIFTYTGQYFNSLQTTQTTCNRLVNICNTLKALHASITSTRNDLVKYGYYSRSINKVTQNCKKHRITATRDERSLFIKLPFSKVRLKGWIVWKEMQSRHHVCFTEYSLKPSN